MRLLMADSEDCRRFLAALAARAQAPDPEVEASVRRILEAVRQRGDAALFEYCEKFDGLRLTAETVRVPDAEMTAAAAAQPAPLLAALRLAADRIAAFHRRQLRQSWLSEEGGIGLTGQLVRPLARVGLYVPGGTAAYPSSVLMNAIPAVVAGVAEIAVCTPAGRDGRIPSAVLAAAQLAGIREVYRVGGAQAIAALAFGTRSIPRVDKIVGPGNIYVVTAKRLLFGVVGIDMVAGPSEVLVIADETAVPSFVAADLLAQAEHDPLASAVCLTPSRRQAEAVRAEVLRQLADLPRRETAQRALAQYGAVVLVPDLPAAAALANRIAPEHLELLVADPWGLLPALRAAGALFLGAHSPEVAGDYLAGPNHVLPTAGSARWGSPLSAEDFQKRSSLVCLRPEALRDWREPLLQLARQEGLEAHARSIAIRTEAP
ncbi:MAG: histidinol dehydrogenase [candidate division NC10 bacterium]|nr:histidinol dehydrogenase [candidate division NC10 bacterium]